MYMYMYIYIHWTYTCTYIYLENPSAFIFAAKRIGDYFRRPIPKPPTIIKSADTETKTPPETLDS